MTQQQFKEIFDQLQAGTATGEQMELLLNALQAQKELDAYFQTLLQEHFNEQSVPQSKATDNHATIIDNQALNHLLEHSWQMIDKQTSPEQPDSTDANTQRRPRHLWLSPNGVSKKVKWAFAASILLIAGIGTALYLYTKSGAFAVQQQTAARQPAVLPVASPITPGRVAAVLTLQNGQQVSLDSNMNQNIKNGQQLVAYNKAGKVDYQTGHLPNTPAQFNTLTTRKGNRYQLVLPDGTKAWLNAESSIRFPDKFSENNRTVWITGEVYFEVIHDENRPFSVQVKGLTIRDFGTAFNVNAYDDEPTIKTTLLEGVIEVNNTRLKPGWQAINQANGKMSINKHADLSEVTSWKNNMFLFHETDMRSILRQVARWYNVQIIYQGNFDQTFTGGISRQTSLDEILKILSFSNKIKFNIHDRNIIVQPN